MRPRTLLLPFAAALAILPGGCGTFVNLTSPPQPGPPGIGPTACFPFGGASRSVLLGGFLSVGGFAVAYEDIGKGGIAAGAGWTAAGLWTLCVDAPLSFLGDLVTYPVALARSRGEAWATWWGDPPWDQKAIDSALAKTPPIPGTVGDGTTPATAPEEWTTPPLFAPTGPDTARPTPQLHQAKADD